MHYSTVSILCFPFLGSLSYSVLAILRSGKAFDGRSFTAVLNLEERTFQAIRKEVFKSYVSALVPISWI